MNCSTQLSSGLELAQGGEIAVQAEFCQLLGCLAQPGMCDCLSYCQTLSGVHCQELPAIFGTKVVIDIEIGEAWKQGKCSDEHGQHYSLDEIFSVFGDSRPVVRVKRVVPLTDLAK